jgi:hypothetical protein
MAQAVPTQHPAVVLRSHYMQLRALLVVTMIAVVGLTVAVVILATDDGKTVLTVDAPASGSAVAAEGQGAVRSDGGPEESAVAAAVVTPPSAGPDESRIASSIGRGTTPPTGGPDESQTAAAISGR